MQIYILPKSLITVICSDKVGCACTHTHRGVLFLFKEGGSPVTDNNMDEPGGYYPKLQKPDTEGHILYELTYMGTLKESYP